MRYLKEFAKTFMKEINGSRSMIIDRFFFANLSILFVFEVTFPVWFILNKHRLLRRRILSLKYLFKMMNVFYE